MFYTECSSEWTQWPDIWCRNKCCNIIIIIIKFKLLNVFLLLRYYILMFDYMLSISWLSSVIVMALTYFFPTYTFLNFDFFYCISHYYHHLFSKIKALVLS